MELNSIGFVICGNISMAQFSIESVPRFTQPSHPIATTCWHRFIWKVERHREKQWEQERAKERKNTLSYVFFYTFKITHDFRIESKNVNGK